MKRINFVVAVLVPLGVLVVHQAVASDSSTSESPTTSRWGKVFVPKPLPGSQCQVQVDNYLRGLGQFELSAMQMWDSTAKPTVGLLSDNGHYLGNYDSCLSSAHAQYCLALVDLRSTDKTPPTVRTALDRRNSRAVTRSNRTDPGHLLGRWTTVHWGLCVPAACSALEVQAGLEEYLAANNPLGIAMDAAVSPSMCYTSHRTGDLPLATIITLGFFGGVIVMALVATVVDNDTNYPKTRPLSSWDRALLAFSLRRNLRSLLSSQEGEIPVINGIRTILAVILFIAHKSVTITSIPFWNRDVIISHGQTSFSVLLRGAALFTDSFLQLSAMLTAFSLARELSKYGSVPWHHRVLAKFIRLTPALLAVLLFYAYVMEYLGSGPQWQYVTTHADLCKTGMWRNILYVQNLIPTADRCAFHTPHLAIDMQLFLATLVAVFYLHRWFQPSVAGLVAACAAVVGLRYHKFLQYNASQFVIHNASMKEHYLVDTNIYTIPMYRSIPCIVGLLTGFYLQRFGKMQLTQVQAVVGWTACALVGYLTVFYPSSLAQPDAVFDVRASTGALYSALSPLTWAAAIAWVIVACTSGYGGEDWIVSKGWLNRILCHHWFVVFSRLTYSMYLTQFIVFFYIIGSPRAAQEVDGLNMLAVYEVVPVMLISLVTTLLFDLPIQDIKNILLPGRTGSTMRASKCCHSEEKQQTPPRKTISSQQLSYYNNPGSEPLQYLTIGELISRAASRWPDRDMIVSCQTQERLSFSQADQQASVLAEGLLRLGLVPGDRLAVCSPNSAQWILNALATFKSGLVLVCLNPAQTARELHYCLQKVAVRALVTFEVQQYHKMCEVLPDLCDQPPCTTVNSKDLPHLDYILVNSQEQFPGTFRLDDVKQSSTEFQKLQEIQSKLKPELQAIIQFTSGSTGQPKAVPQSHFNIVNNSYYLARRLGLNDKHHKILAQTPLFHALGILAGVLPSLHFGCTMVLPSPYYKAKQNCEAIKKERCTMLLGTPTMYVDLCSIVSSLLQEEQLLHQSPELAVSSGGLCTPELSRKIKETFSCQKVVSVYGMTETTGPVFQSEPGDSEYLMVSTVGRVLDHFEVKVVDAQDLTVPLGTSGELWVRSYSNLNGYWEDVTTTASSFTDDRWFKTGDEFILLQGGYGQLVGRIKDVIIRGGENISPKEVEELLVTLPSVLDAQVYGVHSDRLGEEVACSLRLRGGCEVTEQEVREFCNGKISYFKIPKYIETVKEFPKTGSGKIQKSKLREAMEKKLGISKPK